MKGIFITNLGIDLKKLSITAPDGFVITDMTSKLTLSNHSSSFENTQIQTPTSSLIVDGKISYPDFDSFITKFLQNNSTLDIQQSTLSKEDILYFIDDKTITNVNFDHLNNVQFGGNLSLVNGKLDFQNFSIMSGTDISITGSFSTSKIMDFNSSTNTLLKNYYRQFNFPMN